jgi:hypothetical protein
MQDDVVRAYYLGLQFPQQAMAFEDILVIANKQKLICKTYEAVFSATSREVTRGRAQRGGRVVPRGAFLQYCDNPPKKKSIKTFAYHLRILLLVL